MSKKLLLLSIAAFATGGCGSPPATLSVPPAPPMAEAVSMSELIAAGSTLDVLLRTASTTQTGRYTPTGDEKVLTKALAGMTSSFSGGLTLANDMTNHGFFARFSRAALDVTQYVSLGYGVYEVATGQEEGESPENVGLALVVGGLGKLLNTSVLDGLAEEAEFVVEAGKRFKLLLPRVRDVRDQARRLDNTNDFASKDVFDDEVRDIFVDMSGIASSLREILELVPADYRESHEQAIKDLSDAIDDFEVLSRRSVS